MNLKFGPELLKTHIARIAYGAFSQIWSHIVLPWCTVIRIHVHYLEQNIESLYKLMGNPKCYAGPVWGEPA